MKEPATTKLGCSTSQLGRGSRSPTPAIMVTTRASLALAKVRILSKKQDRLATVKLPLCVEASFEVANEWLVRAGGRKDGDGARVRLS